MCYALFIGVDEPLRTEDAVKADDRFHFEDLQVEHSAVRALLSKPYVYYVAAWGGCGCGWFTGWSPLSFLPSRRAARRRTAECVAQLKARLEDILTRSPSVELYLGWAGELDEAAARRTELTSRDFAAAELPLKQGDLATVRRSLR